MAEGFVNFGGEDIDFYIMKEFFIFQIFNALLFFIFQIFKGLQFFILNLWLFIKEGIFEKSINNRNNRSGRLLPC